jgi:hypothetical protein
MLDLQKRGASCQQGKAVDGAGLNEHRYSSVHGLAAVYDVSNPFRAHYPTFRQWCVNAWTRSGRGGNQGAPQLCIDGYGLAYSHGTGCLDLDLALLHLSQLHLIRVDNVYFQFTLLIVSGPGCVHWLGDFIINVLAFPPHHSCTFHIHVLSLLYKTTTHSRCPKDLPFNNSYRILPTSNFFYSNALPTSLIS